MREHEIAIIAGAGFGMRDFGSKPGLWFSVNMVDGVGSLQCFFGEEMEQLLSENKVHEVRDLNGKPCYVHLEDGLVIFERLALELLR